jgi:hypothetical protein
LTFLLVWDKGSYTGSFLVIFPYINIFPYISNWLISFIFLHFYLGPFLMVVSTGLRILYLFLYREYINNIHLLNFLLLPHPSHMWPPLSVTSFSLYCCICIRSLVHIWERTCGFWPSEPG